jgi:hypothetical protein
MTSPNPTQNDPKLETNPPADAARKADKPSKIKRELTDEETAAVAAGAVGQHYGT